MVVIKKYIISVFCVLLFIGIVSAGQAPLKLKINQNSFIPPDKVIIYAEIYNSRGSQVMVNLDSIMESSDNKFPLAIIPKQFILLPNQSERVMLYNLPVAENFENGMHMVTTSLSFNGLKIISSSLEFDIEEFSDDFVFNINIPKKIYLLNEKITLDYTSNINPKISAKLTYPDGDSKKIKLPYTFSAKEVGTYGLEVIASGEGYKTKTIKGLFGIIDKIADIKEGILQTSPATDSYKKSFKNNYIFYISIFIIIILIGVVIFFVLRRRKAGLSIPNYKLNSNK